MLPLYNYYLIEFFSQKLKIPNLASFVVWLNDRPTIISEEPLLIQSVAYNFANSFNCVQSNFQVLEQMRLSIQWFSISIVYFNLPNTS